ncbi:type IV pilus assembly protein PilM [Candidatus Falkowbacteria bacterium]|nr:type IV pilus assembly protein PilM [Candidatus Falkowbacteria bacterium]
MSLEIEKKSFGLDISERALRFVQFKKSGKKIFLKSFNQVNLPESIIKNGEIIQPDKMVGYIKELTNNGRIKNKNVISVLPESKTFIKVIEIQKEIKPQKNKRGKTKGKKSSDNLEDIIKKEIVNHIPLSLDETYIDWQVLNENETSAKLLVGLAPKNIVDSYFLILEKSGLAPYILEIEAAPIIRALIPSEQEKENKEDGKAKIIIDFGAVRTGLIFYDEQTVKFTSSLPISGNRITETIANTLKLDAKKAEKAKIICGLDEKKCEGALRKILFSSVDNLASQIKKSIAFYKANFPNGNQATEVILCGGGANFIKIDQVLAEKLNIPVKIGNPLINVSNSKKMAIDNKKMLSYTTAIGLGLRSFEKDNL